jgi:pyruvate/2-oxoglutarate dehydrogenase complex dihydrolipoamide acyltransferase (E2) component
LLVVLGLIVLLSAGCHRRSKAQAPSAPPVSAPAPSPAEPPRPPEPAPELAPNITPQEQARAESAANNLIRQTESNLQKTTGKDLSATQRDLLERANSFLKQARAAAQAGDWARASNLAQKAFLLSEDLSRSLP